uniref:Phosphagen kinase C-terminal domain-containing protein n=1 Tax=Chromera velia CCMP2878 TaxID=1169474 RepID=A0A0G4H074_9ALVE|eukprot:Cvel_5457.t1-p1 / transcript=Cvel_5457.t1 / gene=Cvel_5457 / organism=Chromera_velia_CCMP2878 / gene_product=Taurocyamine kinase, putative / transcript_product=Taurocyamine kinase, putative / location=Cvel_scaffold255:24116-27579(+) / protein_length=759 / sequence_SO=supercontig / SO=protein_coding / is_pseudo=false
MIEVDEDQLAPLDRKDAQTDELGRISLFLAFSSLFAQKTETAGEEGKALQAPASSRKSTENTHPSPQQLLQSPRAHLHPLKTKTQAHAGEVQREAGEDPIRDRVTLFDFQAPASAHSETNSIPPTLLSPRRSLEDRDCLFFLCNAGLQGRSPPLTPQHSAPSSEEEEEEEEVVGYQQHSPPLSPLLPPPGFAEDENKNEEPSLPPSHPAVYIGGLMAPPPPPGFDSEPPQEQQQQQEEEEEETAQTAPLSTQWRTRAECLYTALESPYMETEEEERSIDSLNGLATEYMSRDPDVGAALHLLCALERRRLTANPSGWLTMFRFFSSRFFFSQPSVQAGTRYLEVWKMSLVGGVDGCAFQHTEDLSEFGDAFCPLIGSLHGIMGDAVVHPSHASDPSCLSALPSLHSLGRHVSVRIRVARNLREFRLPSAMSAEELRELMDLVQNALEKIEGGGFYVMEGMDEEEIEGLTYAQVLPAPPSGYFQAAGVGRDWCIGRAGFVSFDGVVWVWVNEEDHLRVQVISDREEILDLYGRLQRVLEGLERGLGGEHAFARHEELGYVSLCSTNVGSGMHVSVLVSLPLLSDSPLLEKLCAVLGLARRGARGEGTSAGEFGEVDLSPLARFSLTEVEIVLSTGCCSCVFASAPEEGAENLLPPPGFPATAAAAVIEGERSVFDGFPPEGGAEEEEEDAPPGFLPDAETEGENDRKAVNPLAAAVREGEAEGENDREAANPLAAAVKEGEAEGEMNVVPRNAPVAAARD